MFLKSLNFRNASADVNGLLDFVFILEQFYNESCLGHKKVLVSK